MPSELDQKDTGTLGLGELVCRAPESYPFRAYDHPRMMVAELLEVKMVVSVVVWCQDYRLPIG